MEGTFRKKWIRKLGICHRWLRFLTIWLLKKRKRKWMIFKNPDEGTFRTKWIRKLGSKQDGICYRWLRFLTIWLLKKGNGNEKYLFKNQTYWWEIVFWRPYMPRDKIVRPGIRKIAKEFFGSSGLQLSLLCFVNLLWPRSKVGYARLKPFCKPKRVLFGWKFQSGMNKIEFYSIDWKNFPPAVWQFFFFFWIFFISGLFF